MKTKAKLLNVREHLEAKDEMLHEILLKIKAGEWHGRHGICSAVRVHMAVARRCAYIHHSTIKLENIIAAWLKDKRYKHPDNISVRYPVGGEEEYYSFPTTAQRHAHPRRVQLLNYMIRATAPRKSKRKSKGQ